MSDETARPTGHLQVRLDWNRRTRSFYAFWRDQNGERGGCRLGPAHVRDSGRRTPRGAIIWRTGNGPRPTPEHLTPRDAESRLATILRELASRPLGEEEQVADGSLRDAAEGWLAERMSEKGLKRSTIAGYEDMFERLYRDLGAETPVSDLADGRLRAYFADFQSYRVLGEKAARKAKAEGKDVRRVEITRWTAQPPGSAAVEVTTKTEAVRLADELPGTWKHRRRGCYRVVQLNAQRPKRVSHATARQREAEGWIVAQRTTKPWMLVAPAAAQTRNAYRDIFAAILDHAVRCGWLPANPLAEVKRTSKRHERQCILRRDDFYDRDEIDRLLKQAPSVREEAFWLLGVDAGFRLPGEALGLRKGAVDFQANVIRVYDNWVRNAPDTTKTSDSEAIPMTSRLARALVKVLDPASAYATENENFVFAGDDGEGPVSERSMRKAFKLARQQAGLKPIKMYNLRHSFGTTLAQRGVDVRTIQALIRHDRITTTEQYMAYRPQPELAVQITRHSTPTACPRTSRRFAHARRHRSSSGLRKRYQPSGCARWNASSPRGTRRHRPVHYDDATELQQHLTVLTAPTDLSTSARAWAYQIYKIVESPISPETRRL
jgi:integrase